MEDYKGMFYHESISLQYYEGGAHFKYKDLYKELDKCVSLYSTNHKNTLKNYNKYVKIII